MTIPSIRFQARNRQDQNSRLMITFSSSSYSSENDDIPQLQTGNENTPNQATLTSRSIESGRNHHVKESDWTAKRKSPTVTRNQIKSSQSTPTSLPARKIEIDDVSQSSDNEFVLKPNNDDNDNLRTHKSNNFINSSNSYYNNARNNDNTNTSNNYNYANNNNTNNFTNNNYRVADNTYDSTNNINHANPNNNNLPSSNANNQFYLNTNNNEILSNQPKILNQPPNPNLKIQTPDSAVVNTQKPPTNQKLLSYLIFRQKNKRSRFRMEKNSNVIFFGSESKDSFGKILLITQSNQSSKKLSNEPSGFVRISSNHDSFIVYTNEEKFNDDRQGELCGIEIVDANHQSSSKIKNRKVRILLTKDGKPHYPISKRKSLSKIIQHFEKNSDKSMVSFANGQDNGQYSSNNLSQISGFSTLGLDRFVYYESINPLVETGKAKSEEMAKLTINPSSKNFVIRDNQDNTIFLFYKISSGSFNVSFAYPITPEIAFGISMAVLSVN